MMNLKHFPDISVDKIILIAMGVVIGGLLAAFVTWLTFGDTNFKRCERAVPYAEILQARLIRDAIMCKSIAVGESTERITWLDKNGVPWGRLD